MLIPAVFSVITYVYFLYSFTSILLFLINFKNQDWIENETIKSIFPFAVDPINNDSTFNITALLKNCSLLLFWAFHHSLFARQFIKKFIPKQIERSLYVLIASGIMHYLLNQWTNNHINGGIIFQFIHDNKTSFIPWIGVIISWFLIVAASFFIDHFQLFGLKQGVFPTLSDKNQNEKQQLKIVWGYKFVRHPMMSFALIMLWISPIFSFDRLIFSVMSTVYIIFGVYLEEMSLRKVFGVQYDKYTKQVPHKFFYCPFITKNNTTNKRD